MSRRGLAGATLAMVFLALGYLAWPLLSAWHLRQAMMTRDVAALEQRVDWPLLRANLKPRLAGAVRANADQSGAVAGYLKRALGDLVADKGIDWLVTPQTLTRLLAGRELYLRRAQQAPPSPQAPPPTSAPKGEATADADDPDDPMPPRRLRWAFFDGPNRFRFEAVHPRIPQARISAVLARQGLSWRLVDVDVADMNRP